MLLFYYNISRLGELFSLFLLLWGLSLLELGRSCMVPPAMTAELYGNILLQGLEPFPLIFETNEM